jgi:hypothetical protein
VLEKGKKTYRCLIDAFVLRGVNESGASEKKERTKKEKEISEESVEGKSQ